MLSRPKMTLAHSLRWHDRRGGLWMGRSDVTMGAISLGESLIFTMSHSISTSFLYSTAAMPLLVSR